MHSPFPGSFHFEFRIDVTILDELAAALKRERRQGNADNWNEVRKAYFNIETAVERENAVHAIYVTGNVEKS